MAMAPPASLGVAATITVDGSELSSDLAPHLDQVVVDEDVSLPAMFAITFLDPARNLLDVGSLSVGSKVEVSVAGEMDEATGWLVDFGEITAVVEPILKKELDHRALNDVPGLENPTSEVLCGWLWRRFAPLLPGLSAVTVQETCSARCTIRGL